MQTSSTVFDKGVQQWIQEQSFPWNRLKCKLAHANLLRHIGPGPLRVLDAGGGIGSDSIPLAKRGHRIDLVDYSKEMLAEAAQQAQQAGVGSQITTHHSEAQSVGNLFPEPTFDLVLSHNVIQYVADVPIVFKALTATLRPGGFISIITTNRYSTPYKHAFANGNLTEALAHIDQQFEPGAIFDATLTYYAVDEISAILRDLGLEIEHDYGIRCLCDYWGNNDLKSDPAIFEQLERLEFALTDKYPYKLLARFFQIIARKA